MHSFSSPYNENTVIPKEYPGTLDFAITGVDYIYNTFHFSNVLIKIQVLMLKILLFLDLQCST